MKKILLTIIGFLITSKSVFAVGFIDKLVQPQLKVVDYNQKLETLKLNLLDSVSIFSDTTLYEQRSNMITSIGILVFIAILIKVGLSVIRGSKDNILKFIAFNVLLFIIGSAYAPIFSKAGDLMAGKELTYTDPNSGKSYSRIYLPANTAISVQNQYINDKTKQRKLIEEQSNLFRQRGDGTKYDWEYYGIPAKVAQTQWQSESDPTLRESKAFYGVDLDVLFKGNQLNSYLNLEKGKELGIVSNGMCEVTIQPSIFSKKVENTPMTLLAAIGEKKLQEKADLLLKSNDGNVMNPQSLTVQYKNKVSITEVNQQVTYKKDCNNFPLGIYLLSDQYLQSIGNSKEDYIPQNIQELVNLTLLDYTGLLSSETLLKLLSSSGSYAEQKKIIYLYKAYTTLYGLTQLKGSKEIKESSDQLKESILACGRIINGTVQESKDYKNCLFVDQAGDTTIYTQETSQKLGLLGKNKEGNEGYVFPVPTSMDWSRGDLSNTYGDMKSIFDHGLEPSVIIASATEASWENFLNSISTGYTNFLKGIKIGLIGNDYYEDKIKEAGIDFSSIPDKEKQLRIYQWLLQKETISNPMAWYAGTFNPILASFNSYDLDGDGQKDYTKTSIEKDGKYYAYHYGETPSLYKDSINFTSQSFNKTIPWGKVGEYCEFIKDINQAKIFSKCKEINKSQSFNGFKLSNINYFTPKRKEQYKVKITTTNSGGSHIGESLKILKLKGDTYYNGTGLSFYDRTPVGANNEPFQVNYKDGADKKYSYLPYNGTFNGVFGYDKSGKNIINIGDQLEFKEIGFTITKAGNKEIFILNGDYTIYKDKIGGSVGETQASFEKNKGLTVNQYKNLSGEDPDTQINLIYSLKNKSNLTNISNYNYLERQSEIAGEWKHSLGKNLNKLLLMEGDVVTDSRTQIFSYINLIDSKLVEFPLQIERKIKKIYSSSPSFDISSLNPQFNNQFKNANSVKIKRDIYEDENGIEFSGLKKETTLQLINYDSIDKVFEKSNEDNTVAPRLLLNPLLNIPLTYTPSNLEYLKEYKNQNPCLITKDNTTAYKYLFEPYPTSDGLSQTYLNKCSRIGDHMRITDIRLQTYTQKGSLFNVGSNSEIFTHYSIPLLTSNYISDFSGDRRIQNYAGEVKASNSMLSPNQVAGITVKEGDVFVLKPGVLVGAYSHPFTLLVPTEIVKFIKYVRLDDPSEELSGSYSYTGGIYDWITKLIRFMKEGEISTKIFKEGLISENDEEKYGGYIHEKYDSRPDSLKFIEGSVPDRYFHAYYGEGYYNDSEAGVFSGIGGEMSNLVLNISNWILGYRVDFLKWIFMFSPLLTFFILFEQTRKIFSFTLALTVGLLILPVVILFLINLFNI